MLDCKKTLIEQTSYSKHSDKSMQRSCKLLHILFHSSGNFDQQSQDHVLLVCRGDVDMEAKLLQKVQQAQKSGMDQRLALLESSLAQSLDSSLASQSGLAHRVSSGLQDLSHSIKQDKANQVGMGA